MKISRLVCVGVFILISLVQNGESTVILTGMLMSFVGGFLAGKTTLALFLGLLMAMQRNTGTTVNPKNDDGVNRDLESPVNLKLEARFRDKFLQTLGSIDRLNCLPNVFCELSATSQPNKRNEAQNDASTSTKGSNNDDDEDDEEEENGDNVSRSNEHDEEYMKVLKEKEFLKLQDQAIEEMMQDDPSYLYYALRDKKKNDQFYYGDVRAPPQQPTKVEFFKKFGDPAPKITSKSKKNKKKITKKDKAKIDRKDEIDSLFEDDPFFKDFRRRRRRDVDETEEISEKFRIAANVGEKFKSVTQCRKIFNSCPFEANEIMKMITTLKASNHLPQDSATVSYTFGTGKNGNENLVNLKNTLLTIEGINNATLLAKRKGRPVNYKQVLEEVIDEVRDEEHNHNAQSLKIMDEIKDAANSYGENNKKEDNKYYLSSSDYLYSEYKPVVKSTTTKPPRIIKIKKKNKTHIEESPESSDSIMITSDEIYSSPKRKASEELVEPKKPFSSNNNKRRQNNNNKGKSKSKSSSTKSQRNSTVSEDKPTEEPTSYETIKFVYENPDESASYESLSPMRYRFRRKSDVSEEDDSINVRYDGNKQRSPIFLAYEDDEEEMDRDEREQIAQSKLKAATTTQKSKTQKYPLLSAMSAEIDAQNSESKLRQPKPPPKRKFSKETQKDDERESSESEKAIDDIIAKRNSEISKSNKRPFL